MADTVAFLGQQDVHPSEIPELRRLGRLLAQGGAELHTSTTPGATATVLAAYQQEGGKAVLHERGLHRQCPWFLIYGSDEFVDRILAATANDDPSLFRHWGHITGRDHLRRMNRALEQVLVRRQETPA